MLISPGSLWLNAQTTPGDTLKKVRADTLEMADESGGIDEIISYSAKDSTVAFIQAGRVILYGEAKVVYGSMNMEAEFLEIDYNSNIIKAYGRTDSMGKKIGTPTFKDGEQAMQADTVKYNLKTKKGKIYNALTRQGELLVKGSEIKKDSNDVIYFKDMLCLPCQDEDARTGFRATKAKVIPNDKIVTGPMFLEVGGVPTPLGLPFGYFPNTKKQHNGILMPTFGNSPAQGYNLRQGGFYWGINDKTNLIFRGDIYANGSWLLGATNNYNVLYKASGSAGFSYSMFNIGDRDIPAQFNKQKAYTVDWTHTQDNRSNPTARFSANVNFRNNQNFNRLNAVNSGQFLTNTFQSNINYSKTFKFGTLSSNAMHSQNSLSRQMDITFPSLTFNVNRFYPFKRENAVRPNVFDKIQVYYVLDARNTLSGRDSTIFKGSILDSMRNGIRHTLPISTNFNIFKYITATPAINLNGYMYGQTIRKDYISDGGAGQVYTRTRRDGAMAYDASFSTSFNTQVYFDYLFMRGKVKQIRHLMIPTLGYSYRPDFGEERFGAYKQVQIDSMGMTRPYSIYERGIFGGPVPGKQNALSINLNNNIEAKVKHHTDTGITFKKVMLIQNISLNTDYNFAADSFKMRPVNVSARTVLFKYFDIVTSANLDPYRYDQTRGDKINYYQFAYDGRLARLTNMNLAVNTSIGSNMLEAMRKTRQAHDMTNAAERGSTENTLPSSALSWNLRIGYNLGLTNYNDHKLQPGHMLNFSGDINPTKYWKVGVTSGFDFNTQQLSYTSLNIYRDLKCWEARIDWVPFGARKSYSLAVNLKTAMLSEFKIPRQRQWFDNFQ